MNCERTSKGVQLNSAGELFIQHVRAQIADLERVKSRIADLKGMRLGTVRIEATPEVARNFLPAEIQAYREKYAGVTFEIHVSDRTSAEHALISQAVDLAIVLQPTSSSELHSLLDHSQQLYCLMRPGHEFASRKSLG